MEQQRRPSKIPGTASRWKIIKKLNQGYTKVCEYCTLFKPYLNHTNEILPLPIHSNNKTVSNLRVPCLGSCLKTKIKKLQTLQNKFLIIALRVLSFLRNKQLHNYTGPHIYLDNTTVKKSPRKTWQSWQSTPLLNRQKIHQSVRLKPRLPQDTTRTPKRHVHHLRFWPGLIS